MPESQKDALKHFNQNMSMLNTIQIQTQALKREEERLLKQQTDLAVGLTALNYEYIETEFKKIKSKINPDEDVKDSFAWHLLREINKFEPQMKMEWANGNESYVKKNHCST